MKNDLVYLSFKKLKQHLLKYFIENPIDGWVCEPWGDKYRFNMVFKRFWYKILSFKSWMAI